MISMPPFEEIDHTADWAFRVRAATREQLFAEAAEALYRLGGLKPGVPEGKVKTIHLESDDLEGLLILWLNELLFLIEHDRQMLQKIQIEHLNKTEFRASGRAAEILAAGKYIKAATYSGLRIIEENGIWQATIVLDV